MKKVSNIILIVVLIAVGVVKFPEWAWQKVGFSILEFVICVYTLSREMDWCLLMTYLEDIPRWQYNVFVNLNEETIRWWYYCPRRIWC